MWISLLVILHFLYNRSFYPFDIATSTSYVLIFDPDKLIKIGRSNDIETKIQPKLIKDDPEESKGFTATSAPSKEKTDKNCR
jgi:hypothetical protein